MNFMKEKKNQLTTEQATIIQTYLHEAYKKVAKAREIDALGRSRMFPRASRDLEVAEGQFDILSALAKTFGVSNPWEPLYYENESVHDLTKQMGEVYKCYDRPWLPYLED